MEQTARFISRPRRIEELRDFAIGMLRPYRIVSTICLGGIQSKRIPVQKNTRIIQFVFSNGDSPIV